MCTAHPSPSSPASTSPRNPLLESGGVPGPPRAPPLPVQVGHSRSRTLLPASGTAKTERNWEGNLAARVVIADDHPLFLQALQVAVKDAGVEVTGVASRGDELLALMDAGTVADAVLLDLQMPGMDGFECMQKIRASRPDVRMIVVSATNDEEAIRRALDAGAVCFIGKSIDPTDLAAAVRALLSDAVRIGAPTQNGHGPEEPAIAVATSNGASILTKRE